MSEFKEKLQGMKDSINENMEQSNLDDGPIFISDDVPQEEQNDETQVRNEQGRRKRRKLEKRFEEVLADNRGVKEHNHQLIAALQEQEARLEAMQAQVAQNTHYSNVYYEKSLENDEQRVLTELRVAKENADTDQEVVLSQRLAQIEAQKQTQLLSKTLQQQQVRQPQPANYPPANYYPEQQFAPPPQQEYVNEHFEDWLENNSWADPNSPNYNQELSSEVNEIALNLNKHLSFNKSSDVIGTPDYYRTISKIMNDKYNGSNTNDNEYDEYEEPVESQPQYRQPSPANGAYAVAPVTKRGSSMTEGYNRSIVRPTSRGTSLTQVEWDVAAKMASTYSIIWGRPVSEAEAVAEYVKQKRDIPSQQQFKPNMQKYVLQQNY